MQGDIKEKMENLKYTKKHEALTGVIFYCRDSGYFNVSASNKLSCNLTGQCFEIGNKNIPPNRSLQARKTKMTIMNLVSLQT
jgi:hypothetical protein